MFLQPHHFQQEARFVDHLVDARVRAAEPHAWGFSELVLDEGALALGRLGLTRASGVLPDGAPFSFPNLESTPAALDVPVDLKGEVIYLAAPVSRPGTNEFDLGLEEGADMARYRASTAEIRDQTHASDDAEAIQTAELTLRLLRGRDLTDGFAAIGVARVLERRGDGQLVLDRNYIAPQTRIEASGQLSAMASLLHGLVRQRAGALAGRMGQLSHGVSEMAEFLMLMCINRAEPWFHQLANAPSAHPRELHLACLQLAGEMATFAADDRMPRSYPLYQHGDLQASFAPVIEDLRRFLSSVLERHATQIELIQKNHGVRLALVADGDLLRNAGFVLAVGAQMPVDQLRQRFPSQSKFGPVDRLIDLVNLQLPGVVMRSLPTVPRELPFHAGFQYFELDRSGELWKQLERDGRMALHVGGDFPGLELELWAIRQP
jgi:type VI secretion system protein ImpJ